MTTEQNQAQDTGQTTAPLALKLTAELGLLLDKARDAGGEVTDFVDYAYAQEVVVFEQAALQQFAALVIAAERERWHGLAVAFRRLDDLGFILSCREEGDAECGNWLRIARESLAGHGLRA